MRIQMLACQCVSVQLWIWQQSEGVVAAACVIVMCIKEEAMGSQT